MPQPTFILTGMPRSGTTYLAALLHYPPKVITQSEAGGRWKQLYLDQGAAADPIPILDEMRSRIARGEPVATFEGTAGYSGAQRIDTWNQKKEFRTLEADQDFALGVKNPEVFLEWIPRFVEAGLRCVLSVRHPLGIINSWVKQEERKRARGRAPADSFAQGVSVTWRSAGPDSVQRRIELHNHFAERIVAAQALSGVLLAPYEGWFENGVEQLRRVGEFLGVETKRELVPPPLPPDPVTLSEAEQSRIVAGCAIAREYGAL
jgi:hypothetical protein